MIYKLLAVNIDGTLLQTNGRFSKVTKEAIQYVHSKGVAVVLVSSRNYQSCKRIAKALKINPMIVAAQGAYVSTAIDQPFFIKRVSSQTTADVVNLLENISSQLKLHFEETQVANRMNLPENFIGKAVLYASESKMSSQQYVNSVSEYLQEKPSQPNMIEAHFQSEKEQQDVSKALLNTFSDVTVVRKEQNRLLIVPNEASKWQGISSLAEQKGIRTREIVAIGDSLDDVDCIIEAGMGVAMGNAPAEIKQNANWITRSNDDEGVAYMVKELFRKQYQLQFLEKMNLLK